MIAILTILGLAFAQNVSFTIVSRSRNRSSFSYHMIASVFSNGLWFLTFRQLILHDMAYLLFIPYTLGTVAGSLCGAKISMWIERRIGARSDSHLEMQQARGTSGLWWWCRTLLSGRPHFIIGGAENPYMRRWFLIPRNHVLNIYLHKFLRDDEDRALHDHPWWFVSLMLWGGYSEVTPEGETKRGWLSLVFRPAEYQHRVVLRREKGRLLPCWTLVVTGSKRRTWGFWCPKGFVPWHEFVDVRDAGKTGRGCGE